MLTVGFVFQTSRNLEEVLLRNVTNIVVSQEELVMDVIVSAGNPNILPVVMGEVVNIDIFARSDQIKDKNGKNAVSHVARHREQEENPFLEVDEVNGIHVEEEDQEEEGWITIMEPISMTTPPISFRRRRRWPPWHKDDPKPAPPKNITEGTSLLLGTIRTLESPLSFPPTTFSRSSHTNQKSQMKLFGPAVNATDGTEKWKKIIQTQFELIVRGTMKYRAPIGGRERAVVVEWRGNVDPKGNLVWNGIEWEGGD
jgi:hypothetical protein